CAFFAWIQVLGLQAGLACRTATQLLPSRLLLAPLPALSRLLYWNFFGPITKFQDACFKHKTLVPCRRDGLHLSRLLRPYGSSADHLGYSDQSALSLRDNDAPLATK